MNDDGYQIGTYYFPHWHSDPTDQRFNGYGWTEWDVLRMAKPKFEGHVQPKVPLWGYGDESDPEVMEKKIKAAVQHHIDAFIFDWYWTDNGPYLNGCIDRGFMPADKQGLKFAVMWTNHDTSGGLGIVKPGTFIELTDYVIHKFFTHPSYWKIDGKAYFSIYNIENLVHSFGSVAKTAEALEDFRRRAKNAGVEGININAVQEWGIKIPRTVRAEVNDDVQTYLTRLGIDSITSYGWVQHTPFAAFPSQEYSDFSEAAVNDEIKIAAKYGWADYYPNMSMGWDPSPRTSQSGIMPYENKGYPYTTVLVNNTPDEFKKALQRIKDSIDQGKFKKKVITMFAWNEWGEGGYLEPDTVNGMGYLEAIKAVFEQRHNPPHP